MKPSEKIFLQKIYIFARKERFYTFLGNLLFFLLLLIILWFSVTIADNLFYFSELSRWGLLLINAAVVVLLAKKFLYRSFLNILHLKKNMDLPFTREEHHLEKKFA